MMDLFHTASGECSKAVTKLYSTSFASAIQLLHHDLRQPVYNIYGFVRLADEIVDTFHTHNKEALLARLKEDTYSSIASGLSLNPILNSFQLTVNRYKISNDLIEAFFNSMEMDLGKQLYDEETYQSYIYGSAEVVGLMCLYIFCEGNIATYNALKDDARSLGAAFQKVNFLRDIKADFNGLNRTYFPGCDFNNFSDTDKMRIELDIENNFRSAYKGIMRLPVKARFGVYVAFKYYQSLFKRIKKTKSSSILEMRVRIPNYHKAMIVMRAGLKNQLRLI